MAPIDDYDLRFNEVRVLWLIRESFSMPKVNQGSLNGGGGVALRRRAALVRSHVSQLQQSVKINALRVAMRHTLFAGLGRSDNMQYNTVK